VVRGVVKYENLADLDDKELYEIVQTANDAMKLLEGDNGKIFKKAAKIIEEKAIYAFANNIKATDSLAVMEQQVILRKYKYGLFSEVQDLAEIGIEAQKELDGRIRKIYGNQTESDNDQES